MSPTHTPHRSTAHRARQPRALNPQQPKRTTPAHEAATGGDRHRKHNEQSERETCVSPDRLPPGAIVRYHDTRRGHRRIGRIDRILSRGPRCGHLEITPLYGSPRARLIVPPDALIEIL